MRKYIGITLLLIAGLYGCSDQKNYTDASDLSPQKHIDKLLMCAGHYNNLGSEGAFNELLIAAISIQKNKPSTRITSVDSIKKEVEFTKKIVALILPPSSEVTKRDVALYYIAQNDCHIELATQLLIGNSAGNLR